MAQVLLRMDRAEAALLNSAARSGQSELQTMKNYKSLLLFWLVILTSWFAVGRASAQSNLVLVISEPGDYIGQGQTYVTTKLADMGLSGSPALFGAYGIGAAFTFAGPGGANLTVGIYTNSARWPFNGSQPGLDITSGARACNSECGSVQIYEIHTNAAGQVDRFWATFTNRCECGFSLMYGEIRYHSSLAPPAPVPRIIRVPADFPTIQAALDNASLVTTDTVLVSPGTYNEALNFNGRRTRLVSVNGPSVTFITAPSGSAAITLSRGETSEAVVCGFTMTGSRGISGSQSSPTIISNVMVGCDIGVYCYGGSPIIRGNQISGGATAAVQLWFTGNPLVEANVLAGSGTGIYFFQAGNADIRNNVIRDNKQDGLSMVSYCDHNIVQNLILRNSGSGIKYSPVIGSHGPFLISNTILDNGAAGIWSDCYAEGPATIINNIVVGAPAVWARSYNRMDLEFNDVYSRTGTAYAGLTVTNLTGVAGNISADPFFACQPTDNLHLLPGSPCIDAGTNGAPLMRLTDLDGLQRVVSGVTNVTPTVDLGAYEFDRSNAPAACLFLFCPSNILVITPPGQSSAVINYPPPFATPGAVVTNWPSSGSVFPAGDNPVAVTATYGTNILSCGFTISVLTYYDYGRAVNATNLIWTTSGDAPWFVQSSMTADGMAAAQSGAIVSNQTSTLQVTVTGPGRLDFLLNLYPDLYSVIGTDFLSVSVNGTPVRTYTDPLWWSPQSVYVGSGPQTVQWTYHRNSNTTTGQNGAWLDLVSFTPGTTPPIITTQPRSLGQAPGLDAVFSVGVEGTPPLYFQWQRDGTNLTGATDSVLVVTNVQAASQGAYSVVISNSLGWINSLPAALGLAEVVGWGFDFFGQTDVPVFLTNVVAVAGCWHHSLALRADGTIVGWGTNEAGELDIPANLTNVIAVARGSWDYSLALRGDGTVVAWGGNRHGETNVPAGLTNAVAIAAMGNSALALKADGTIVSWGYYSNVPANLSNVVAVTAGGGGRMALRGDGTVVSLDRIAAPPGLSNIVGIASGEWHQLALTADGTVLVWGDNYLGQTNLPPDLTNVVAIAAGENHSCALRADGTVVAWGTIDWDLPAIATPGLSNVIAISAGYEHDLALLGHGPPVLRTAVQNPRRQDNVFSLEVPTQSGRTYRLQFRDSLTEGVWASLPLVAGTGKSKILSDTNATPRQRFYRVQRW